MRILTKGLAHANTFYSLATFCLRHEPSARLQLRLVRLALCFSHILGRLDVAATEWPIQERDKGAGAAGFGRDVCASAHGVLRRVHGSLGLHTWKLAPDSLAHLLCSDPLWLSAAEVN